MAAKPNKADKKLVANNIEKFPEYVKNALAVVPLDRGRPTKYKEEYCDMLVYHMAQGYSFDTFAAVVNVCRDTIYEWLRVHENFSYAKKVGEQKNHLFFQHLGLMGMRNEIPFFGANIYMFTMINRFKYRRDPPDEAPKLESNEPQVIVTLPSNGRENPEFLTTEARDVTKTTDEGKEVT